MTQFQIIRVFAWDIEVSKNKEGNREQSKNKPFLGGLECVTSLNLAHKGINLVYHHRPRWCVVFFLSDYLPPRQQQQISRLAQFLSGISATSLPPNQDRPAGGQNHGWERTHGAANVDDGPLLSLSNLQLTVGILWLIDFFSETIHSADGIRTGADGSRAVNTACCGGHYRPPSERRKEAGWDEICLMWEIRARRWPRKIIIIRHCAACPPLRIDLVTSS